MFRRHEAYLTFGVSVLVFLARALVENQSECDLGSIHSAIASAKGFGHAMLSNLCQDAT